MVVYSGCHRQVPFAELSFGAASKQYSDKRANGGSGAKEDFALGYTAMWKFVLTLLGLLYILSPFDILPDWFIGWGWLDDGVIAILLGRFLLERFRNSGTANPSARTGNNSTESERTRSGYSHKGEGQDPQASAKQDPYQVLAVTPDASEDEIKKAYLRLANQYHPDKVMHLGKEFRALAEVKFKEIQQAYEELKKHSA